MRALLCLPAQALLFLLAAASLASAQTLTRMRFTPPVVPETQTLPVLFEAQISGSPPSVVFTYDGADRPMVDDGTNGDAVAGDGTWSTRLTASEVLSKNSAARVFRPSLGQCKFGSSSFNVVGEVWTSAIGRRGVRPIDATGQETEYVVNYAATKSQLLTFDPKVWAQRFYAAHGDKYDFLNFVLIGGTNGNRGHLSVKSQVQGISNSMFDNTAQYGSAGRLLGVTIFPIPSLYDGGDIGFAHETAHQWVNFCHGTSFASGIPHWPRGNIAINVMGFSLPGGVGGAYSFTFTPNGSGGQVVGAGQLINQSTFNSMELYLMGMAAPAEVSPFFVLVNQSQNVTVGQTLQPAEMTTVTVNDVIAARGPRVPDSTQAQRVFRSATIVLSEQLLDWPAMSMYDFFARRSEAKQQHTFASGLATGTCKPWYLATGGRSVMFSRIADDIPLLRITREAQSAANTSTLTITTRRRALRTTRRTASLSQTGVAAAGDNIVISFTGKLGIRYQAQSSSDLNTWTDEGAPVTPPVVLPSGEAPMTITLPSPASGTPQMFYRLQVLY